MRFLSKLFVLLCVTASQAIAGRELLNVSYDPTREFYADFNAAFVRQWKATTGESVSIKQSDRKSTRLNSSH
jgi:sulfate transport system substrate-binding protein